VLHSSKPKSDGKPRKPYPDFPLFPHATGRWAKKIRGKTCYFGPWNDPDAALQLFLDQRDDLFAGRVPRAPQDGLTVRELCNQFLTTKQLLRDTGELRDRTFHDYFSTCGRIVAQLGRDRVISDLAALDFERLRASLAKTRGPVSLGNEIQRVRMVFKYAFEQSLIETPVRYGQTFKKPSLATLRKEKATRTSKNGARMFEAAPLRIIIEQATQPLKAMVLLAINCGFGQTDISSLPIAALNLKTKWVDYPRPKTGVHRRCPLWPETIEAVQEAVSKRPTPRAEEDGRLAFLTKYGQKWVKSNKKGTPADALGQEFAKLLTSHGLKRPGLSFYALRHTFETIGGEARDQVAVDYIMGHAPAADDMSSRYRERVDDSRLKTVTDHVRKWLFGRKKP